MFNAREIAIRNHTASVVTTYTNRLLLDLLNSEGCDADILLAEIDNRGGIAAVEATRYAPIAKAHTEECVALDGEDCCANYGF